MDAYAEAVKTAVESADTAADRVLTASFAVATGYGALIGLIQPAETPAPILAVLPFAGLGGAIVLSMLALVPRIEIGEAESTEEVRGYLSGLLRRKELFLLLAATAILFAVVIAGTVVVTSYLPDGT